jgi:hypothetical protein
MKTAECQLDRFARLGHLGTRHYKTSTNVTRTLLLPSARARQKSDRAESGENR